MAEKGIKWLLQHIIVPLIGSGGIIALILPFLPSRNGSVPQAKEELKCSADFYGLWSGVYTTNKSKILKVSYTISSPGAKIVLVSDLQGEPRPKTYYPKCSTANLIFTDGSAVVNLRVQGPDDLSGLVKSVDGESRGEIELHRSEMP
jgi:hypothetical protein